MPVPGLVLFGFRTCPVSRKCPCRGRRSCFSHVALSYLRVSVTGKVPCLAGPSSSPLGLGAAASAAVSIVRMVRQM